MSGREQHYAALGLHSNATREEVKQAYRKLCVQFHPDLAPGLGREACDAKIKEINAAYTAILKGPVAHPHANRTYSAAGGTTWAKKPRGFSPGILAVILGFPILAGGIRFALFYNNLERDTGRRYGLMNPPVNEFLKEDAPESSMGHK
eukprot:jgi/Tetstr1/423982/TSEL_014593.t1